MSLMHVGDTREVTDLQDELEGQQGTFEIERAYEKHLVVVTEGRLSFPGLENSQRPRTTHQPWRVKKVRD